MVSQQGCRTVQFWRKKGGKTGIRIFYHLVRISARIQSPQTLIRMVILYIENCLLYFYPIKLSIATQFCVFSKTLLLYFYFEGQSKYNNSLFGLKTAETPVCPAAKVKVHLELSIKNRYPLKIKPVTAGAEKTVQYMAFVCVWFRNRYICSTP